MTNEQREYQALQIRYDALSRDWNKHRDLECKWRTLRDRVFMAAGAVMGLAALSVVLGL